MSTRRDGHSLADMVRAEMGRVEGAIAGIGILLICIIILAVLALVVVQALKGSPWGTFTVFCTVPIAFIMGVYGRYIRRGRIFEMSAIGFVLLMAALIYGRTVSETPALAAYFNLTGPQLALIIIGYGFVASVLPVWLLLAPRDYLSTFLKIGAITLLAIGSSSCVRTCKCRRSPNSSTAPARSGRAACSRSCSSPLPAGRCRAGIR